MDRTDFFPRNAAYLFSFDVDLRDALEARWQPRDSVAGLMFAGGHVHQPKGQKAPVYNVLGDSREQGERSVRGRVVLFQEHVRFPPGREFGELDGRLVIDTDDDHESLEATYAGVFRADEHWHWLSAAAGEAPSALAVDRVKSLRTKAFVSLFFDVGSTRYAWLSRYQCVGYGHLTLNRGCPSFATFDVYGLESSLIEGTAPSQVATSS